MAALASLASTERPAGLADAADWPPRILVVDATPDDRAALARIAARHGAGNQLVYAPILPAGRHGGDRRRGPGGRPAGRVGGERARRHRFPGGRRPGHRLGGRGVAGDRGLGRHPRRATRSGAAGGGDGDRLERRAGPSGDRGGGAGARDRRLRWAAVVGRRRERGPGDLRDASRASSARRWRREWRWSPARRSIRAPGSRPGPCRP